MLGQRLAFDLFGDEAEQVIVRIVVFELGARFEMCRPIEGQGEYLLRRPHLVRIMVQAFGKFRRVGEVIEATPHLKELANGDLVTVRDALNVFRDQIVEAQFPFLDQLHDDGGRHRLGVRCGPEMGIGARRVRDAELGRSVA